jgi:hypothetical protein
MEESVLIIQDFQAWIYLFLGLLGLIYLRLALKWYWELRRSIFGLEREQAAKSFNRAVAMLAIILAGLVAVFIVATFVGPTMPVSARPTVVPTISLIKTEQVPGEGSGNGSQPDQTPIGTLDSSGCLNPTSTLTYPISGDELRGVVEITGTANIENFAFYKIEYLSTEPDSIWRAISAGTEMVMDDVLGTWDTSLVPTGDYRFRLVVTDTAGNAPLPCVVQIRVLREQ